MIKKTVYTIKIINILLLLSNVSFSQIASLKSTLNFDLVDNSYVPVQNKIPLPCFEKQLRPMIDLAGNWKKQRFSADHNFSLAERDSAGYNNIVLEADGRHKINYNDSSWDIKVLPAVENQLNGFEQVPEYYQDGVWYRRKFTVDDSLQGKSAKLICYSINYIADLWLNNYYLGYHEGGYTPFAFDISGILKSDSINVLSIRVDNPPWGTRQDIIPYTNADWFNYTGIIHDIYIEFAAPQSVYRSDIEYDSDSGQVIVKSIIKNDTDQSNMITLQTELFNAGITSTNIQNECAAALISSGLLSVPRIQNLLIPADSFIVSTTHITIANPDLWSPANPNLYVLKNTLFRNNVAVDSFFTQFGLRKLQLNGKYLSCNNKTIFLTGVARHEDHPDYGRSIPIQKIYEDLKIVRDLNALMLRTAHYPNHPYTYILADRLGIAVMEEIPVWWFDETFPWVVQNNQRKIHLQMWREMILRDFNRPSVFFWSTCNECLDVTNRKTFIEMAASDMHTYYPNNRIITQSAAADRPGAYDPSQATCDIAGWTMYFGIFYGNNYYQDTKNFLNNIPASYPDKAVINTEFGYWSGEGGWNLDEQVSVFNETYRALYERAAIDSFGTINSTGFLCAINWWCVFDWYSHQHPSGFQSMGLYKMDRVTGKPVASRLQKLYHPYYALGGMTNLKNSDYENAPGKIYLSYNYPNPFNPETTINYVLNKKMSVKIEVFNLNGQLISVLVDQKQSAGNYTINFNAQELASGVYFYRFSSDNYDRTRKMILLD